MTGRYLSTSCELLAHAPVCKERACQCTCHLKVAAVDVDDPRKVLRDRADTYSHDALVLEADGDHANARTYRIVANELRQVADQFVSTKAGGRPASTEPAT